MATSVISAFNEFQKEKVNLDSETSKDARASKDWLIDQIHKFPENDPDFPTLYNNVDIQYGSFARRTKIRPLDDIDLMIGISARGSSYDSLNSTHDDIEIYVPNNITNLYNLCNDDTYCLNSVKVLNKFKSSIKNIPQYSKSAINVNQEAVVLNLTSYEWSFDIVPCFFTQPESDNRTYYLMPNGKGKWKKTDPSIDNARVSKINQEHDGNVLNVIRILKYWNKRPTMPTAPSYLFENIILSYYEGNTTKASEYVDMELPNLLYHIHSKILSAVDDPKNIQGNINNLPYETKKKISDRAYLDYTKALEARKFETDNKKKESINKWREIFGDEFPKYE